MTDDLGKLIMRLALGVLVLLQGMFLFTAVALFLTKPGRLRIKPD